MSADRPGGRLRCWFLTARRSLFGVFDGGVVSPAVEPSIGSVRLQLAVWEQRL